MLGWKEFEMEVVRDRADNCIIVCSIENVDPMGIHTGDSVTVAPALTLTDKEYQRMRDASIACLRAIGVDTGGSNVQFAVNPADGRMVVIEMNPRVSRSSALASKATGFPIAKIAAKLAVGYTLDELANDITRVTPASFEPTIDYVVVKIPRFTFEKFPGTPALLTTSMKSVGEAMAIGRSFAEALQKGLRSMETGLSGLDEIEPPGDGGPDAFRAALSEPRPDRLLMAAQALRAGLSVEDIHEACKFDPWFLRELERIVDAERDDRGIGPAARGRRAAAAQGAGLLRPAPGAARADAPRTTSPRCARRLGVHPVYKRIDTCAAEFASATPYMYSTYEGGYGTPVCEADPDRPAEGDHPRRRTEPHRPGHRVRLLLRPRRLRAEGRRVRDHHGQLQSGNRQHRLRHLRPAVFRAADRRGRHCPGAPRAGARHAARLHRAIWRTDAAEAVAGAGARAAFRSSAPRADAIDIAEDRERFQQLLHGLGLRQPENGTARSAEEAEAIAERIGYPVVIRPSYVLGGRAMEIVYDRARPASLHARGGARLRRQPGADRPLSERRDRGGCGLHRRRRDGLRRRRHGAYRGGRHPFRRQRLLAAALHAAARDRDRAEGRDRGDGQGARRRRADERAIRDQGRCRYTCWRSIPRASRTVPFVAKATGVPVAKIGARVMAGAQARRIPAWMTRRSRRTSR